MVQDRERRTTGLSAVTLLVNLHAEHIVRNARLDELQAGIKIGGRNINNLRVAETKEELKGLLIRVKEESERAGLRINIKLRSWNLAPLLHAHKRGKGGCSDRFPLLGLQKHYRW